MQNESNSVVSQEAKALNVPSLKELFQSGVHFGHETRRWNPKMDKFIYTSRKGIHILDLEQTQLMLEQAMMAVADLASKGSILIVGSKNQASDIVKDASINSGAHFVDKRWAGGLLTNYPQVKKSLNRLRDLETMFEKGVEGRTKYEISLMKKEWEKLNRLYSGVKTMEKQPSAMILVDVKYERGALREANRLKIPVIAMVDTNSEIEGVTHPIPSNDDAISSIKVIINALGDAVRAGNSGNGIHHLLKDYSKVEVQIIKKIEEDIPQDSTIISSVMSGDKKVIRVEKPMAKRSGSNTKSKGILEGIQNKKDVTLVEKNPIAEKKVEKTKATAKPEKTTVKPAEKKTEKASVKK